MTADDTLAIAAGKKRSAVLTSCVCALLAAGPGAALELGEASVHSHLGQPLELTIPFNTWGNERLTAECVSLVRGEGGIPALTAGRAVGTTGGRLLIRSEQNIREPLLTLNVKVDCPSAPFIVRSYTVILDPPDFQTGAAERVPEVVPTPAAQAPVRPKRSVVSATPRPSGGSAPTGEPIDATEYRVRVGDTLSVIAARVHNREITIWQAAERIFRANPQAFVGGSMDRLRAGVVLSIPDMSEVAAAPPRTDNRPDTRTATTEPTAPVAPSTPPLPRPAEQSVVVTAAPRQETRVEPLARPLVVEPKADAQAIAATPSPFKDRAVAEPSGDIEITPAGPVPVPAERAADNRQETHSVSPLFSALVGAGIGLLLGLIIFRGLIRDVLRRSQKSDAVPWESEVAAKPASVPVTGTSPVTARSRDDTDILPVPALEPDDSLIVSEGEWYGDFDTEDEPSEPEIELTGRHSITAEELARARMSIGSEEEVLAPGHRPGNSDATEDDGIIFEVDTGAELSSESLAEYEDPAVATMSDLKMLEEDYEQQFSATQQLTKQLADAALALDHDLSDDAASWEEEDATAVLAGTGLDFDVGADVGEEDALLEGTEMLPEMSGDDDATNELAESEIRDAVATRLPSGDEDETPETPVMRKKRRA